MPSTQSIFIRTISIAAWVVMPQIALADPTSPFYSVNQNPLIQLQGLPPLEKGIVMESGVTSANVIMDITSASISEVDQQEQIIFDGETYRLNLMFRHGLKQSIFGMKGVEVGIDIPFVSHRGGSLDGFIRNWHNVFGLSNSERDQFQDDQLDYQYRRNGVTEFRMLNTSSSIGDIRLSAAWQLTCRRSDETDCSALRASLKLPTGKAEKLSGSGGLNFSLAHTTSRTYQRYTFNYGGGLQFNGPSDLLNEQRKNLVGFASAGVNYQPKRFSWMVLKAQLDGHSAMYASALKNLGSDSVQINVGGSILFSAKTALDIGVIEDIVTSTIPDVVFHFALRTQYR
ncbi:MAG: DUF3187 family protein [Gammaproteobacteria bacterium]|nr:DUF3187 family protein [Gammaproteobacteria bacterium]